MLVAVGMDALGCDDEKATGMLISETKVRRGVYIPRRFILNQVMDALKLKVHSSAYDSTLEALGMETAWMHVDLPCGNQPGSDSTTVIFGTPQASHSEADESACQAVLNYYSNARDVKIDDYSHSALKMKQEQLDASNFFCNAMQDKMVLLVLERDAALNAVQDYKQSNDLKIHTLSETLIKKKQDELNNDFFYEILQDKVDLLQDRNIQKDRYNLMVHDIASICGQFHDLLPIKKIQPDQNISEYTETGFVFVGNKNNPSHIDQLALALLKILHDGIVNEANRAATPF